jgi:hypothetical protein
LNSKTKQRRLDLNSKKVALLLGVPIGFSLGLMVPAVFEQVAEVEPQILVTCESFEGPQGPMGVAGKDGRNGRDGKDTTVKFIHVPELDGLFHEQNVMIEHQD